MRSLPRLHQVRFFRHPDIENGIDLFSLLLKFEEALQGSWFIASIESHLCSLLDFYSLQYLLL